MIHKTSGLGLHKNSASLSMLINKCTQFISRVETLKPSFLASDPSLPFSSCITFSHIFNLSINFPSGSVIKNPPMQETQEWGVRSLGGEDPLYKEMATHSSVLAWKISWTEETGGLQSMVGHKETLGD